MKAKWYILFCMIACIGCRKPYTPPAISSSGSYLVVEGAINPGSDSTTIVLSRTVNISSATTVNPEAGATVTVVSDQNASLPLTETGNGRYVSAGLNLDPGHKYGIQIKTADNR